MFDNAEKTARPLAEHSQTQALKFPDLSSGRARETAVTRMLRFPTMTGVTFAEAGHVTLCEITPARISTASRAPAQTDFENVFNLHHRSPSTFPMIQPTSPDG
jgi:hypothetical protein